MQIIQPHEKKKTGENIIAIHLIPLSKMAGKKNCE